jgi:hypothetical protein
MFENIFSHNSLILRPTGQKETWTDTSSLIKTWIKWVHNTHEFQSQF